MFRPRNRIYIIDRKSRMPLPQYYYSTPFVVYHHVNAYEVDGHIVFDVIAHNDNRMYEMFYMANLRNWDSDGSTISCLSQCRRYVIPLHMDKDASIGSDLVRLLSTQVSAILEECGRVFCIPEVLGEGIELPRINYNYNGKDYSYIYVDGFAAKELNCRELTTTTMGRTTAIFTLMDLQRRKPDRGPEDGEEGEGEGEGVASESLE
uniref:beta,beta-carotene 15,15'-dioxygenase-like isoform X1 n=1 Tax=Myxine glutinosa TaxID=7769 RepID=UPI00358ED6D2